MLVFLLLLFVSFTIVINHHKTYSTQVCECTCYQKHLFKRFFCRWNQHVRLGKTRLVWGKRALLSPPLLPPSPVEEEQAVPPSTPSPVLQCLRYLWPLSPPAPRCPVVVHTSCSDPFIGCAGKSILNGHWQNFNIGPLLHRIRDLHNVLSKHEEHISLWPSQHL